MNRFGTVNIILSDDGDMLESTILMWPHGAQAGFVRVWKKWAPWPMATVEIRQGVQIAKFSNRI